MGVDHLRGGSSASDTTDPVDTGLTAADLVGRALIIHGHDGGRIGCALLHAGAYALDWEALHSSRRSQ